MTTVNTFLILMTVMLLYLCILTLLALRDRVDTQFTIHQHGDVLFGDPLDIWRMMKVPEREAAQVIRRAARLGYKEIQHLYDQAGNVYIHFQLCPPRRIENVFA